VLVETTTNCLLKTWSPEQIANTATAGQISLTTIYRWLYAGIFPNIMKTIYTIKASEVELTNVAYSPWVCQSLSVPRMSNPDSYLGIES
jgi:IS30 family transposase